MQFMNVYDTPFITVSCCQGPCLRWELLLWQKARTVQLPKWKGNLVEMKEVLTHRREDHLTICMYKEKVQVRLADHGLMALFKTETRLLKNINGKSTLIFHWPKPAFFRRPSPSPSAERHGAAWPRCRRGRRRAAAGRARPRPPRRRAR